MNARRIASSLVFTAAAFASIATSRAPTWRLEDLENIELTEVPAGPATAFAISAEGRAPRDSYDRGEIIINVLVRRIGDLDPVVKVRLISETDPSRVVDEREVGDQGTATFIVAAWETCEASPCFEDVRIEIENLTEGSSVNVSGDVRGEMQGLDTGEPEPGSEVIVEVTPLGVAP